MKKAFTLIEMVIVLLVIGILMAATMRFGSGRIVDLKAQSFKEQFAGYYHDIYSQNMTSSFRDGKKYQRLVVTFESGMRYQVDGGPFVVEPKLSSLTFRQLMLDGQNTSAVHIQFTPYVFGCFLTSSQGATGHIFSFQAYVPENGKQYCFEISSETCKLVEHHCE